MKMFKNYEYQVCLPDPESMLPEMAKVIDADYEMGSFSKAEDDFNNSGEDEQVWRMVGKSNVELSIQFEKYEGYLFTTISGKGKVFLKSKTLLYETYLRQGGNPDAQEKP